MGMGLFYYNFKPCNANFMAFNITYKSTRCFFTKTVIPPEPRLAVFNNWRQTLYSRKSKSVSIILVFSLIF